MFLRVQSYNPSTRKFNVLPVGDGDITTTSPKPNSPKHIVNVPVNVPTTPSGVWSGESSTQLPDSDAPATPRGVELSDSGWSATSDPDIKLNPAAQDTVNVPATASEWCGRQSDIQPWHGRVTPFLEPEAPRAANAPVTSPDELSGGDIDLFDSGWSATNDINCFESFGFGSDYTPTPFGGLEMPGASTGLFPWDRHSTGLSSCYNHPLVDLHRNPSVTHDDSPPTGYDDSSLELYNQSLGYDAPCFEDSSLSLYHEPSEPGLASSSSPAPSSSPESAPNESTPPDCRVSGEVDEREAVQIIGEEAIGGEVHYMVVWKPTLEPERNLGHMKGLIKDWRRREALRKGTGRILKRARGRPRRCT